jgi:hypothetical protein
MPRTCLSWSGSVSPFPMILGGYHIHRYRRRWLRSGKQPIRARRPDPHQRQFLHRGGHRLPARRIRLAFVCGNGSIGCRQCRLTRYAVRSAVGQEEHPSVRGQLRRGNYIGRVSGRRQLHVVSDRQRRDRREFALQGTYPI